MTSTELRAPAGTAPAVPEPRSVAERGPWARFSWILGAVWIIFMYFPIVSAWYSPAPLAARVAAICLLAVFAVTYIAAYIWTIWAQDWQVAARRGAWGLLVLTLLLTAAAILVGVGALGAGAFLVSLAMFAGPLARALTTATVLCIGQYAVLTIALAETPGGFASFGVLYAPPTIVLIIVGCVRVVMGAQTRHDDIERQMSLVAERERVARDVHDVLGHSLTVVTVKAELAERLVDLDPERAKQEISQIRSLSREALAEVRATVSGLRVARLGDELDAARMALAGAGIDAELPESGDVVDPRHRIVVAWTLREAITNVVRHAGATRCRVALSADGIVVEDDGVGTPQEVAERALRGIRERVHAAGATLTVERALGGPVAVGRPGTRVEVRW